MSRFAVVNLGTHAAALSRVAPRLRGGSITAVVESDGGAAKRVAEQLGVSVWATSTEELHQKHDAAFDAWATPTMFGWFIRPHDNRPLEANPEVVQEAGLWGNVFRFLPSVLTVKEGFTSGKLGAPGLVRIHYWSNPELGQLKPVLFAQLDIACWLIDQPATTLFAQHSNGYVQVHLGFADDRMAVIDCATLPEGDEYYSLSVIGSSGAAYADDHHNMQLVFGGGHPQAIRTSQGDRALLAILQEFVDARTTRRLPSCSVAEQRRASRLLNAVGQSIKSKEAVALMGGES